MGDLSAATIVDEARRRGVDLIANGDRLRIEAPAGAMTPDLLEALRACKPDIIAALRAPSARSEYEALAESGLADRVRCAWPWLAEHRADLFRAVCDADESVAALRRDASGYAEAVAQLREAMEAAVVAWESRSITGTAVRIYSRLLDAEAWIVFDDDAAAALRQGGVTCPVIFPEEAEILAGMAESDAHALLGALAKVQRAMPGARLRRVRPLYDA